MSFAILFMGRRRESLSSLSLSLFACVSFIDFTSFHSLYSLDLISLCILPGDDPEGTLEVKQYAETGQGLADIDWIHGTPPRWNFT